MSRPPPHNEEAEKAVIGSILLESSKMLLCTEAGVSETSFYIPAHRSIFKVMSELSRLGIAIDPLTVESRLKNIGCEVASSFIDSLVDSTPTSAHAQYYIDIMRTDEMLRQAIHVSRQMENDAYNGKSPQELLSTGVMDISEILNVSKKNRTPESYHEEHIKRRERAKTHGVIGYPIAMPDVMGNILNSWVPPDNVVIGAKSSAGKTMLMLNEFLPQAMAGIPVAIFSSDMTEFALRQRMASRLSGVNSFKFGKPYWTDLDAQRIDEAYEKLNKLPIYINDDSNATCDDACAWFTAMVAKYGVKLMGLDFIQQLNLSGRESMHDMRIVVGDWSRRMKSLGKRFNALTFIISQLARYGEKASDKTPPVPNKESLKETGNLEQNADIVGLLAYAPDKPKSEFTYENPIWDVVFNIDKQRDGPTGMIDLCLRPATGEFMSRESGTLIREEHEEKVRQKILEDSKKK